MKSLRNFLAAVILQLLFQYRFEDRCSVSMINLACLYGFRFLFLILVILISLVHKTAFPVLRILFFYCERHYQHESLRILHRSTKIHEYKFHNWQTSFYWFKNLFWNSFLKKKITFWKTQFPIGVCKFQ